MAASTMRMIPNRVNASNAKRTFSISMISLSACRALSDRADPLRPLMKIRLVATLMRGRRPTMMKKSRAFQMLHAYAFGVNCSGLGDKLHREHQPKRGLSNVKPRAAHARILHVVIPTRHRCGDRHDGDPHDNGDGQDELECGVRDRRGLVSVHALTPCGTNEQLAETAHGVLLR